jgi:hypothetical protein
VVGAGAIVWIAASRSAPAAPPVVEPPPQITIEPIDPPVTRAPDPVPAPPVEAPPPPAPVEAKHTPPPPPVRHSPAHKDAKPAAFTHDQLVQKFQQVRREYDQYKTKFGSRLESEWGDLATFIQFMPANDDDTRLREAAHKLDAFRARMHE